MITAQNVASTIQQMAPEIRRRHARDLAKIARRFDEDDLVQAVALKAHRSASGCNAQSIQQLRHWVLTIAKRTVISAVAHELVAKKRSLQQEIHSPLSLVANGERDICEMFSESEQAAADFALVDRHLAQLPARQAQALRSRFIEELEYSEIAAQMNVTMQAVRSLVSKGLANLRVAVQ